MDYSKLNVLLTEGACRQTLPMAKAFRELGCQVTTLNDGNLDVGNLSRYPSRKIVDCCSDQDRAGTREAIARILKSEHYDLVVPMSDFTAGLLAREKDYFSQYAKIGVNDWEVFNQAFDKTNTMAVCMDKNIACPKTYLDVQSAVSLTEMRYPVVVKPTSACGSIGFNIAPNMEKLVEILGDADEAMGPMLIQEYIPQKGKQFNAHLFLDNNHEVKMALAAEKCRWFPVDGGASTLCMTVNRPDIIELCSRLLKALNWQGYCDVDLMVDPRDNLPKIIEVNARISANVKICYLAGMNVAQLILENSFGQEVTQYTDYKEGLCLRYLHTDLIWFIKSKDRFSTRPSWFSLKNTSDQIFSIKDPLPWFGFTAQAFKKYGKEMKKRERK